MSPILKYKIWTGIAAALVIAMPFLPRELLVFGVAIGFWTFGLGVACMIYAALIHCPNCHLRFSADRELFRPYRFKRQHCPRCGYDLEKTAKT